MPKVSDQHIDRRRQQILQAAFRCFARKGFHQTTMREICGEAGLSPGGVYCHFKGKDDIIQALARWGREGTRQFFERTPQKENALDTLQHLTTRLVESLDFEECLRGVRLDIRLWGEALHDPQIRRLFLQGFQNVTEPFIELLDKAKEEGQIERELSSQGIARALAALQLGLSLQKAIDPKADTRSCTAAIAGLFKGMQKEEE